VSGRRRGSEAVDEEYTPPFEFNGKIDRVTVELKPQ
jgi:hypothetical protein